MGSGEPVGTPDGCSAGSSVGSGPSPAPMSGWTWSRTMCFQWSATVDCPSTMVNQDRSLMLWMEKT
ncbi:hypothetical protein [Streptomyces olivaceoviridis]|uniref:hypothetical protein n=1 Tax=Streptomyces olivaceoviridis TaxID=1921 RepID=UPI0036F6935E